MRPALPRRVTAVGRSRESLDVYLDEITDHSLMSAAEERERSKRLVGLRARYWGALLSHPSYVDAIVDVLERELASDETVIAAGRALMARAVDRRTRRNRASTQACGEAMVALAHALSWADPDSAIAERVRVDVEALARGDTPSTIQPARSGPRGGRPMADYLQRVRGSAEALRAARHAFAQANLRLVVMMARRYLGQHLTLSDLIQEGNLGLMVAIDRFDYRRGFRFSTYASWWIRHYVQRGLANQDRTVRVPCHMGSTVANVARVRSAWQAKRGRDPTPQELAREAGISEERLDAMSHLLLRPGESLDARVPGSDGVEGRTRLDSLEDEEAADPIESVDLGIQRARLFDALQRLSPMEADVVRQRFGLEDESERTLQDIGQQYSLSRERIRQIQNEALGKLRAVLAE
jgi:RNA polymerase primary sigma factor